MMCLLMYVVLVYRKGKFSNIAELALPTGAIVVSDGITFSSLTPTLTVSLANGSVLTLVIRPRTSLTALI